MSWLSDLFGGSSTPTPTPPNYAPIANALEQQGQFANNLAQQQFAWAQQQYANNQGQIQPILQNFEKAQTDALSASEQDRARYQNVYQPLEDRQIQDANTYDSPENMERMRGRAEAGVAQNFESQRQNTMHDLESYGINPGAVRYAGLDTGVRMQQAAAQAAAGNQSDLATEATGRALRGQMIQVGQTIPSQIAAEQGMATGAGGAGVGGALNLTASGAGTMGNPTQWFGGGSSALTGAGSTMNTGFQNSLDAAKFDQQKSSGLGTLLGGAAGLGMSALGGGGMFGKNGAFGSGGAFASAEGGEIPESAQPAGAPDVDGVPARLTPGEFVIPKDVVQHYGTDKLQKMIQKARGDKSGKQAKPQMRQALPMAPTYRSAA